MRSAIIFAIVVVWLAGSISCHSLERKKAVKVPLVDFSQCSYLEGYSTDVIDEIHQHQDAVDQIINLLTNGDEKGSIYEELAYYTDFFGPRMCGSKSLNDASTFMMKQMRDKSKLDKVHGESAMIPKWEIGRQWAEMTEPVKRPMTILALGTSVGTNGSIIEGEVALVHSFEELDTLGKAGDIKDKIVVYNYNFTTYGKVVPFRTEGALRAAKYGAKASLLRSVGSFSIYSPHTGVGSISIPTAALTIEDAEMIERWVKRGKTVSMKVYIDARNLEPVQSQNIIGDITGSENPEQVVLVSGHMDSWYNTEGAMDDGGGMMISYKALDVLRKLNLRAKRTVRAVLWTCEEFGLLGVKQYFEDHKKELNNFKVVMESDLGTFTPLGLSYANFSPLGQCYLKEILALTKAINTTRLDNNYEGSDIEYFTDAGVPGLSLLNQNERYFWYHHTSGDSITMENPDDLDKATALWAASSYVMADLSVELK